MAKNEDTSNSEVREAAAVYDAHDIPPSAVLLEGFREWSRSDGFPETGRIDYLAGEVETDMSPEDLYTHGTVKTAIVAELFDRIARPGNGFVFADSTRVSSPVSDLSAEPDVVVALLGSFDRGSVRHIPAVAKGPGRFVELEGAPDLVVEILSDSSVGKDTQRLPPLYAAAGVGELWLIDARGPELRLDVKILEGDAYRDSQPDAAGWVRSPMLAARIRLTRQAMPNAGWLYELDVE
ncbi:MAG: Uma2 family endonuclease [bacterium]|nr:Uma2 family endonuclease [bacterium]